MAAKRRRKKSEQKEFHPVATFFKIVVSIVLVFCVTAGAAAYACYKITGGFGDKSDEESANVADTSLLDALQKKDIKMNVAVLGVDKDETRTDVIFVVHFDSKQKRLGLISVPRDTRVEVTDEIVASIKAAGRSYSSPTKINAIHAYSPKEEACENVVLQLEDLLNINIDHYVKVNIDAFRKIVDTIGGVEVDVPQSMNYDDPVQDLHIHLQPGVQLLDGDKAEQLVRFRSYPEGDVARVQVQQTFLREFAKKVISSESIIKNLPNYISVLYSDVATDVTLVDALKYVNYIDSVDMNNVSMETLPGLGQMVGDVSYFIHDPEEMQTVVDRIFYGMGVITEDSETDEVVQSSMGKTIEVSNGGTVSGLAGKTGERLTKAGFTVEAITNYSGRKSENTRIIVKESGLGEDLKEYFRDAVIEVDPENLDDGIDIKIILGTNEVS